jgi:hypothetical protein
MYEHVGHTQSSFSNHVSNQSVVDACPAGYPRLAVFLDSDDCFSVYRRFGFLQSRLLLNKQDKLRQLEDALDSLDLSEAKADETRPQTRDLPEEIGTRRQRLLTAIEAEFTSYGMSSVQEIGIPQMLAVLLHDLLNVHGADMLKQISSTLQPR